MKASLLRAENLAAVRGNRLLYRQLSLVADAGDIVYVSGLNGSGKTTLLRALCGLREPDAGEIYWRDEPIRRDRTALNRELFYCGHLAAIKDELSASENLGFAARLHSDVGDDQVEHAAKQFGLARCLNVLGRSLSAGQRRRVALARLLLVKATLWVLDEPFTALDADAVQFLQASIETHVKGGGVCLLTSHQAIEFASMPVREVKLSEA